MQPFLGFYDIISLTIPFTGISLVFSAGFVIDYCYLQWIMFDQDQLDRLFSILRL